MDATSPIARLGSWGLVEIPQENHPVRTGGVFIRKNAWEIYGHHGGLIVVIIIHGLEEPTASGEIPACSHLFSLTAPLSTYSIWWFPKIGVPPNHPLGVSLINHPALGVPPFMDTPI